MKIVLWAVRLCMAVLVSHNNKATMSSTIQVVEIMEIMDMKLDLEDKYHCLTVTTNIKMKYTKAARFLCNAMCFYEMEQKIIHVSNGDPIFFCALSLTQYWQF
jgi:hypothetical protein